MIANTDKGSNGRNESGRKSSDGFGSSVASAESIEAAKLATVVLKAAEIGGGDVGYWNRG